MKPGTASNIDAACVLADDLWYMPVTNQRFMVGCTYKPANPDTVKNLYVLGNKMI